MVWTASKPATARTGGCATGRQATASAGLAGLGSSANALARRARSEIAVQSSAPVGLESHATTSLAPVTAPQAGGDNAVRKPACLVHLGKTVPAAATVPQERLATMSLASVAALQDLWAMDVNNPVCQGPSG